MKRHECFVALSREHHDGLLLATRLQQGPRALLRLWSHEPRWQAEYVDRFFRDHLARHFRMEEEAIFPECSRYLPPDGQLIVDRLVGEHARMRFLASGMGQAEGEELTHMLAEFGRVLEAHIRAEERQLFPLCEQYFPDDILQRIQRASAESEQHTGNQ